MLINIPKKTFDAYCHNRLELLRIGYAVRTLYVTENSKLFLLPYPEGNYVETIVSYWPYWPENSKNNTHVNLYFVSDEDVGILTKYRVYNVLP